MGPIAIIWDDAQQTILRLEIHNPCTPRDFLRALCTVADYASAQEHRVHIVLDMRQVTVRDLRPYLDLMPDIERIDIPNRGALVLLGADRFVKTGFRIAQRLDPRLGYRLYHATTLAEAHDCCHLMNQTPRHSTPGRAPEKNTGPSAAQAGSRED